MEEAYLANIPGVKKKILAGGTGPLPHFPPGTKLVFHFQTLLDDFERTVIDDSRLAKRPAEIFVGKMFKMEIWESLLTSMRVGEVAEFWCDAIHTGLYPIVSKGMRLVAMGKDPLEGQKHMCGMGNLFQYNSTGYPELDELMRTPQPLVFIMELLQVGDPLSYQRESWMMEKDEKMEAVPTLHMQGNVLVKQGQFGEAAAKYKEAVLLLKTVQSREMPGDIDYVNLSRLIIPLELNYCQCMLELEEYYQVIEHATELLEKHKDCVKGYYKRAKAHAAVWNEKEARRDFHTVASLDATLAPLVHRELKALSERMKEKYWEEKEKYWNILGKENQGKIDEDEDEEGAWEKNTAGETAEEGAESVAMAAGDEGKEAERKGESQAPEREKEKERGANEEGEPRKTREAERAAGGEEGGSDRGAPPRGAGEDWQQMLRMVMFLQDEGNFLIKENRHDDASAKFKEAMEYVDFLQYKLVDRKGEDWESLEKVRLPLTLNLSQCMLELHRYRQVVELNSALLKKHKGNLKAVYQRARAHAALCNEDQARKDFATVERLDPTFRPVVLQELKKLGENIRCLHARQNKTYWDTTHEKWGPGGASLDAAAATGAGKRTVTFAQKAEAAGEENRDEEEQPNGGEKPATADKKWGDGERGRSGPNVKMGEESKKKEKSGERVGGNKGDGVLVCVDGLGAPDNGAGDEDSHPTLGGRARDSAGNKRSGCDTSRKKVKCQSAVAQGPGGASRRNKASDGNKGNGVTQSESSNKSKLSTAALKAAGEAEEWEGEEEGGKREAGGTDKSKVKENDEQAAGAGPRTSTGKNDSAAKKSKRKHKKKLI